MLAAPMASLETLLQCKITSSSSDHAAVADHGDLSPVVLFKIWNLVAKSSDSYWKPGHGPVTVGNGSYGPALQRKSEGSYFSPQSLHWHRYWKSWRSSFTNPQCSSCSMRRRRQEDHPKPSFSPESEG